MSELLSVLEAHVVLLTLSLPFSLLLLHLHLDDALELVTLELRLLAQAALLLCLLLEARLFEIGVHAILLLLLCCFLLACCPLSCLHGSLCPECIHFCCLVLSLLLHCPQPGGFSLLVGSEPGLLGLEVALTLLLGLLVFDDLLLFKLLSEHALLLNLHGGSIGFIDLLHEPFSRELLLLLLLDLLSLEGLNLLQYKGSLLVSLLLLLHSLCLAVLDLLYDHLGTGPLRLHPLLLSNFIHFQSLEALYLHHGIEVSLLFLLLGLNHALLLNLRIADSHYLGIEHHLVHVLDVVHVLVQHLLGPLQHSTFGSSSILGRLGLNGISLSLLLHLPNLFLSRDRLRLTLGQGLLLAFLLLDFLFLAEEFCVLTQAVELRCRDDNGLLLGIGFRIVPVIPLSNHDRVLANDHDFLAISLLGHGLVVSISEQRFVDVSICV
mmetsp:Transcript_127026/g.179306  ORF Transcript_127026/g.179306 Transcript_127026/m.179306 type:complete len:435 (+) Transcript_127026:242-1546(+)